MPLISDEEPSLQNRSILTNIEKLLIMRYLTDCTQQKHEIFNLITLKDSRVTVMLSLSNELPFLLVFS